MKEELVLTQPQQEYLNWLCTAPSERVPPSKNKMAEHIGVDVKTLRRWEKKPNFLQQWKDRVDDIQGSPERTQAVLGNKWKKRAAQAQKETDAELAQEIGELSSFNPPGLNELLAEYNLDKKEFSQLIKIVKDHTKSNNDKVKAIGNIQNGAEILIGLLGKLL